MKIKYYMDINNTPYLICDLQNYTLSFVLKLPIIQIKTTCDIPFHFSMFMSPVENQEYLFTYITHKFKITPP